MRIGPQELIIVLIIVLVIFGPKNLPTLGKMFGKTMKNFKAVSYTHLADPAHLLCRHLRGSGPDRSGGRRCCGRLLRSDGRLCRDEL